MLLDIPQKKTDTNNTVRLYSYLSTFSKENDKTYFKSNYFMDYIFLAKDNLNEFYPIMLEAIKRMFYLNDDSKSKTEILGILKENGNIEKFKKLLYKIFLKKDSFTKEILIKIANAFEKYFEISLNCKGKLFFNYKEESLNVKTTNKKAVSNIFTCKNGIKIEIATIHSVKGETHDATLVLETKNREFDISYFLKNPTTKSYIGLRKALYVAYSRPKHLLCLAVKRNNLGKTESQICKMVEKLKSTTWDIIELPTP